MTKSQTIQVTLSECRQKLNELLAVETRSAEQQTELETLTGKVQKLEPELRAAIAAEPDPETRITPALDSRLDTLIGTADLGRMVQAVREHRSQAGADAELQTELKLSDNAIPLELLRDRTREVRGVTPAPGTTGTVQAPIIQPIFPDGIATFLNIPQPSVGVGAQTFPVLTSRPTVETPAASGEVDETTGAFEAEALKAQAAQASFFYRREDAMTFAGMADALRIALNSGLTSELDRQVLRHATQGLLTAGLTAPGNPSGEATFASYDGTLPALVNGREAARTEDCRVVLGAATFAHAAAEYRTNNSQTSALDRLKEQAGGVRVSYDVPAVAAKRQDAVIARALGQQHAVMPLWPSVAIIVDEVTKAKTREIILTAVLLFSFRVLRAAGFARVRFQVVA